MGRFDSSKTRVAPVFDHLLKSDRSGVSWLKRLLRLGTRADVAAIPKDIGVLVKDHKSWWGQNERALLPPLGLLEWLVHNISCKLVDQNRNQAEETRRKRRALACGDPDVLCEALRRLQAGEIKSGSGKWFVLEGPSSPDAFLETDTLVLVVEGKRTESSNTTDTTWMGKRNQLIRHMDAAWEVAKGRAVLGLLLVEGKANDPMSVPKKWLRADTDLLVPSLPHRSGEVRQKIKNGFLGVATWQRVCYEFNITWPPVQDEV